jgi:hypothetical protein
LPYFILCKFIEICDNGCTPEIDEEMYKRILEYRSKEELRFKEDSEQNAKFLYGNLR